MPIRACVLSWLFWYTGERGGGSGTPWGNNNNSHHQQQQVHVGGGGGGPNLRPPGADMRALGEMQPGNPNNWNQPPRRPVNRGGGNGFGGLSGASGTAPNAQQAGDGGALKKKKTAANNGATTALNPAAPKVSEVGKTGGGVKPCEPCEREFTSEVARSAHMQAHVSCLEPGCGFSALRKVLSAHHDMKHGQFSGAGFQVRSRRWMRGGGVTGKG